MYKRADDDMKTIAKATGKTPAAAPSTQTGGEDYQNPPVSENSAMTYAAIIEQMGALYAAMQSMVEQANSDGAMSPAAEKELAGMRSRYDSLVLLRDSNISVMERGAKSASFSVPAILSNISRPAPTQNKEARYADAFGAYLMRSNRLSDIEQRDLSEGTAADGGYLPSTDFYNQLQKKMEQQAVIRNVATVMPLGAFKTQIAIEATLAASSWGAEASTTTPSAGTFGQLLLQPRRLAVIVKVSQELIEDAPGRGTGFSIDTILTDQFAREVAQREEEAFITGTAAANQPVGIMTYTSSGISDGKTTSNATAITSDEILDWVYSLPRQYRMSPNCAIILSDASLGKIRKLAVAAGSATLGYLWQPSFVQGEPDRLAGIPVYASPFMPNQASTVRFGVIGDFSRYIIGQRSSMAVQVLREAYAASGQIGFRAVERIDAGATIYDAFRYIKAAT
jgi:HK97 family phage major capsid protein